MKINRMSPSAMILHEQDTNNHHRRTGRLICLQSSRGSTTITTNEAAALIQQLAHCVIEVENRNAKTSQEIRPCPYCQSLPDTCNQPSLDVWVQMAEVHSLLQEKIPALRAMQNQGSEEASGSS